MANYRIASADITHQFLDGEVVAIDFKSGHYHNLRGAAAPAFAALIAGVPDERLPSLFNDAPPDAPAVFQGLIASWIKSGLLVADPTVPVAEPPPSVAWTAPTSEVFEDMQQLLLADPIHDVGDNAWPRQATDKPADAS
jgi:hypothetical protein